MTILYDEGQQAIGSESRRLLDARVGKDALLALLEQKGVVLDAYWDSAREQGWTALAVDEAYGGLGLGLVELGIVALATGANTAGAPFLTSSFGVVSALQRWGSAQQRQRWLPALASGEAIGCVAFAEGHDPLPPRPSLRIEGGKTHGTIRAVSGGGAAHIALVLALQGSAPVLALVDLSGAQRTLLDTFDNSRVTADLTLDGCAADVIVTGDAVQRAALTILARQAVVTAHEQTGGAEAAMLIARDYANTRKAFGQPIGMFQAIKHRIAELYGLVELARANAIHAAARDGQDDFIKAAAAARLSATEAYDTAARDSIQMHGGIGVTWETGLHLHMRRARTLALEQGNLLFWEDVLVDELTGEGA